MGVPLVLIHRCIFREINHPAFLGIPHLWNPPYQPLVRIMISHHLAPPHVGLNCGSIRSPQQKADFKQRCHPIWEMVDYILSSSKWRESWFIQKRNVKQQSL